VRGVWVAERHQLLEPYTLSGEHQVHLAQVHVGCPGLCSQIYRPIQRHAGSKSCDAARAGQKGCCHAARVRANSILQQQTSGKSHAQAAPRALPPPTWLAFGQELWARSVLVRLVASLAVLTFLVTLGRSE
jgi:hypothetical protein